MLHDKAENYIDLRGTPCPMNFVRCRLFLEKLKPQEFLIVDLDKGEPEELVISGLQNAGHQVDVVSQKMNSLRVKIICGI